MNQATDDKNKRAYRYWTKWEDKRLNQRYHQGVKMQQLATEFERSQAAIRGRLVLHGEFSPLKPKK